MTAFVQPTRIDSPETAGDPPLPPSGGPAAARAAVQPEEDCSFAEFGAVLLGDAASPEPGLLPFGADAAAPAAEAALRVLVVDRDPALRGAVRSVLGASGHEVFDAADGADGLERAFEIQPDLMVVEARLPHGSGLELVRALRQTRIGKAIYVLLLTDGDDDEVLFDAFDSGVDDFVSRPLHPRLLAARLRAGQRVIRLQREIVRDRDEIRRFAAELALTNRRLQEMALTDSLTGFPNRRYALARLQQEWALASRARRPLSVMMLDLDQFKRVNNSSGHDAGDALLRAAALAIKGGLRSPDVVARTGGDEFLVICPDTGLEAALACAERIRAAVEAAFPPTQEPRATVSLGVATRDTVMPDPDALLQRAAQALLCAKQAGCNRVGCTQRFPLPPGR